MRQAGHSDRGDGISAEAVCAQLEKVLASQTFAHSGRLSRFLKFSVEQTLEGHGDKLKEYLLGVQVFDREESYDPRSDPIVRVEAGRLRAKLREYYQTEGRDDPIVIELPKGSYVPVFPKRKLAGPDLTRIRLLPDRRTLALLLLTVLAGFWAVVQTFRVSTLKKQVQATQPAVALDELAPVWTGFFGTGAETFVVFGSPLFVAGEPGSGLFLRYSTLNNGADLPGNPSFQELQKRFGPLSGPRYDYALMGDTMALHRLTAFFGRAGRKLTALPASSASWEAIRDGNIIFLGAPRMIPLLKSLPIERDFDWDQEQNVLNRNPQPGEDRAYTTPSHRDRITYVVIGSFPGLRPKREVLLIMAHSAPGILAATDYLTGPDTIRSVAEKMGLSRAAEPGHYELLLRIFVDQGVPVKTEYVTHHLVRTTAALRR